MGKVHFISLGCARNLVDTEVMLALCLRAGYEITPEGENADWLVVNTCGFLESARNEARETLKEAFSYKKEGAKVIVTGCMVRNHGEELREEFPNIHYMLSAGDVEHILEAIHSEEKGEHIGDAKSYLQQGEVPRIQSTPKHYAYLKIAEGCKKQCAFCIIPTIKGKLQSKKESQVVKEFRALINSGVKEVILIAQDLGDYAKDRKESSGLEKLLLELSKIKGDFWIRLLYLYPDEINDELIKVIQADPRILPYLDMPIQHINNRILKKMFRKTSKEQIISTIQKLREKLPDIVIRTSLMVGFPSETEEEFNELLDFVEEIKLDHVGIFTFSKEELAHAASYEDQISFQVKEDRKMRLAAMQQSILEDVHKKHLGKKLKVIVEHHHPESEHLLVGRIYGQCPEIDGTVIINDWRLVDAFGEFYEVEITDSVGYDLIGRVVKKCARKRALSLLT